MSNYGPIKRRDLIVVFRGLGYTGPFGGKAKRGGKSHEVMIAPDGRRVSIPNPHGGDIGVGLLALVLRQAGITRETWEAI